MDISEYDDIIDTRDIKQRIDELEQEIEDEYDEYLDDKTGYEETFVSFKDWYENNENKEYETLKSLYQECLDNSSDTTYGETLIRYSYFNDYVEELCEECGYISKDFPSWIKIDWDKTADNVQMDYAHIDFNGITYFIRSC